jgi:hypothetical protein
MDYKATLADKILARQAKVAIVGLRVLLIADCEFWIAD